MFYQKGREGTKEIWMNEFADLLAGTVRAGLVQQAFVKQKVESVGNR